MVLEPAIQKIQGLAIIPDTIETVLEQSLGVDPITGISVIALTLVAINHARTRDVQKQVEGVVNNLSISMIILSLTTTLLGYYHFTQGLETFLQMTLFYTVIGLLFTTTALQSSKVSRVINI